MKLKAVALLYLAALSSAAHASDQTPGKISGVYSMDNGAFMFFSNGTRTGTIPSCAESKPTRWSIDGTTAEGNLKVASLLTAFSLGKNVTVFGKGVCTSWADTEEVKYVYVAD